ncbi:uncharacterized protein METZ01_LOCUS181013, partial [marine metagenome]
MSDSVLRTRSAMGPSASIIHFLHALIAELRS